MILNSNNNNNNQNNGNYQKQRSATNQQPNSHYYNGPTHAINGKYNNTNNQNINYQQQYPYQNPQYINNQYPSTYQNPQYINNQHQRQYPNPQYVNNQYPNPYQNPQYINNQHQNQPYSQNPKNVANNYSDSRQNVNKGNFNSQTSQVIYSSVNNQTSLDTTKTNTDNSFDNDLNFFKEHQTSGQNTQTNLQNSSYNMDSYQDETEMVASTSQFKNEQINGFNDVQDTDLNTINAKEEAHNIDENQSLENQDSENRQNKSKKKSKNSTLTFILQIIAVILITLLVSFLVTKYVGRKMVIDGTSMDPTLSDGQHVWVNYSNNFKKGDVVIVKTEGLNMRDGVNYIVKRVIATEGDNVKSLDNKVYLNDEILDEPYLDENETFYDFNLQSICANKNPDLDCTTVPEGYYFLLGDNRSVSLDSRGLGVIKKENIIGKVKVVLYPFSDIGRVMTAYIKEEQW